MKYDIDPTPQGLLRCLQALAEEAAVLSLSRTFAALQQAIVACGDEAGLSRTGPVAGLPTSLVH